MATRVKFAVYASYIEIYNETIFDLLEPTSLRRSDTAGKDANKRLGPPPRVPCKLGEDTGDIYIKNLREIQINNRTEAFNLLKIGQR